MISRALQYIGAFAVAACAILVIGAFGLYAMDTIQTPSYLLVTLFLLIIVLSNALAVTLRSLF